MCAGDLGVATLRLTTCPIAHVDNLYILLILPVGSKKPVSGIAPKSDDYKSTVLLLNYKGMDLWSTALQSVRCKRTILLLNDKPFNATAQIRTEISQRKLVFNSGLIKLFNLISRPANVPNHSPVA